MTDSLSGDEIARLVYLIVLGGVLIGYALVATRGQLGTALRHAVLWGLLFTGMIAGYGLWDSMTPRLLGVQQEIEGRAIEARRHRDGHFHLTLELTGPPGGAAVPVRFILDTGATEMVLTREDAAKLGYRPGELAFTGTARTANGVTRTAPVRLEQVRLGESVQRNVRALINEGQLHVSLLGMGYLSRFSRLEIMGDRLRIEY
jgi:aspartyl protease family protein